MKQYKPHHLKIVSELFEAIAKHGISMIELELESGYSRKTLWGLREGRSSTRIETIIDTGKVVGLELCWKEKKKEKEK